MASSSVEHHHHTSNVKELKTVDELLNKTRWGKIDSSEITPVSSASISIQTREDFWNPLSSWRTRAPVVVRSKFVPLSMVEHLMRHKKDSALAVKYRVEDKITNMEAVLHTWVTPICSIKMTGDYRWIGGHGISLFGPNKIRRVILCASVHLDFETMEVWYQVCRLRSVRSTGEPLPPDFRILTSEEKIDRDVRRIYEDALRRHIIYYVSLNGFIPSVAEVLHSLSPYDNVIATLDKLIKAPSTDPSAIIKGVRYLFIEKLHISVEILFQALRFQIQNEYSVYQHTLPQGLIDIYDPPRIFAQLFGGDSTLINRLRILALKYLALAKPSLFDQVKFIALNDFEDKDAIPLLKNALATVPTQVIRKSSLFQGPDEIYSGPDTGPLNLVLIVKNNSDAFGQNIETEGPGASLDGVIGSYSDASLCLHRNRSDLLNQIYTVEID